MWMASKTYSAREMTELTRCTPGQLDYYREIRLLSPRRRAPEGPFEYDDVNLLRLQQIRIGRAAGLALEEIRKQLDDCACKVLPALPNASARRGRKRLGRWATLYVETEAKVETEADRLAFQREANDLYRAFSAWRRSGAAPADARLAPWVERHRCHIDRWFCPCDAAAHLAFARAIAKNPHLASNIERYGQGLASFVINVIEAHTP